MNGSHIGSGRVSVCKKDYMVVSLSKPNTTTTCIYFSVEPARILIIVKSRIFLFVKNLGLLQFAENAMHVLCMRWMVCYSKCIMQAPYETSNTSSPTCCIVLT